MPEILLVNPRRRKRSKRARKARRRGRSAAQRAATARLLAFNKSRRSGSAPSKRRRRRGSKARRHNRSQSTGVVIMSKRRRSRRRGSRARRRNPLNIQRTISGAKPILQRAFVGALGAVAVNTAMSRLFPMVLPANLQALFMTGRARYLTQGVAALALGMVAQKAGVKAATAVQMAEGSLTVTLTDAIRDFAMQAGVPLGGVGYYLPGRRAMAAPPAGGNPARLNGMSAYVTGPGASQSVVPLRRNFGGVGFGPGRTF